MAGPSAQRLARCLGIRRLGTQRLLFSGPTRPDQAGAHELGCQRPCRRVARVELTIETKLVELDEVYVHAHIEVLPGRYTLLAVSVSDTGIAPEVKARIFDAVLHHEGRRPGTELGLSVVHGIIRQSQGHVGRYTEVGVGARFKMYLPVVESVAAAALRAPT